MTSTPIQRASLATGLALVGVSAACGGALGTDPGTSDSGVVDAASDTGADAPSIAEDGAAPLDAARDAPSDVVSPYDATADAHADADASVCGRLVVGLPSGGNCPPGYAVEHSQCRVTCHQDSDCCPVAGGMCNMTSAMCEYNSAVCGRAGQPCCVGIVNNGRPCGPAQSVCTNNVCTDALRVFVTRESYAGDLGQMSPDYNCQSAAA